MTGVHALASGVHSLASGGGINEKLNGPNTYNRRNKKN